MTKYTDFVAKHRKQGLSMKEIGLAWRQAKGGTLPADQQGGDAAPHPFLPTVPPKPAPKRRAVQRAGVELPPLNLTGVPRVGEQQPPARRRANATATRPPQLRGTQLPPPQGSGLRRPRKSQPKSEVALPTRIDRSNEPKGMVKMVSRVTTQDEPKGMVMKPAHRGFRGRK